MWSMIGVSKYPALTDSFLKVFNDAGRRYSDVFETALAVSFKERIEKAGKIVKVYYEKMAHSDDANVGFSYVNWSDVDKRSYSVSIVNCDKFYASYTTFKSDGINLNKFSVKLREKFLKDMNRDGERFQYLGPPSVFLSQSAQVDKKISTNIFYDTENKSTVVFYVSTLGSNREEYFEKLTSMIPKIMPWLFEESPVSPKEMEFLKALSEDDMALMDKLYKDFLNENDARAAFIRDTFLSFASSRTRWKMKTLQNEIEDKTDEINSFIAKIETLTDEIQNRNVEYNVLQASIQNGDEVDNELVDFVAKNKAFEIVQKKDNVIRFIVKTDLDLVDEKMFESYIMSSGHSGHYLFRLFRCTSNSAIYNGFAVRRRFLTEIFKTHRYAIQVYGTFEIDDGAKLNAVKTNIVDSEWRFQNTPMDYKANRVGNPHVVKYRCYGGYANFIAQSARDCNFIGAFMTALSFTKSLNLSDSIVCSSLVDELFATNKRAIRRNSDGALLTFQEAECEVEQLMNEEAAQHTTETEGNGE